VELIILKADFFFDFVGAHGLRGWIQRNARPSLVGRWGAKQSPATKVLQDNCRPVWDFFENSALL
jgi:hypothetical protein